MKKIILLLSIASVLYSCRLYMTARYKLNRSFDFREKRAYQDFLEREKGININSVIYPDSNGFTDFVIDNRESAMYYGCFLNDSTELIKSDFLKDNMSCMGRVLKEIETGARLSHSALDSATKRTDFASYRFRYLRDQAPFSLNASDKKLKLVLIYSYSSGTYYDSFYREVAQFVKMHKDDIDLFVVTLDNVNLLH